MKEIEGDIWDYHEENNWIVITTNGTLKNDGSLVMGKGIALQAVERFPQLPSLLGCYVKDYGNHVLPVMQYKIITFPVKNDWRKVADTKLIVRSCIEIVYICDIQWHYMFKQLSKVYLPRPGCGVGGLNWEEVKPICEKYLDERFVVVNR